MGQATCGCISIIALADEAVHLLAAAHTGSATEGTGPDPYGSRTGLQAELISGLWGL